MTMSVKVGRIGHFLIRFRVGVLKLPNSEKYFVSKVRMELSHPATYLVWYKKSIARGLNGVL